MLEIAKLDCPNDLSVDTPVVSHHSFLHILTSTALVEPPFSPAFFSHFLRIVHFQETLQELQIRSTKPVSCLFGQKNLLRAKPQMGSAA